MLVDFLPGEDAHFNVVCREQGWKRTMQRRAVWDCLCGNREHPTVEMVWRRVQERLPDVSLDSIYRILDDFSEIGIIRRLEGSRVVRYDADTSPHEHFVCIICGNVFDFAYVEQDRVAALCHAFGVAEHVELTVRGHCRGCFEKKTDESGRRRIRV